MKKLVSVLLALCMAISLSAPALADAALMEAPMEAPTDVGTHPAAEETSLEDVEQAVLVSGEKESAPGDDGLAQAGTYTELAQAVQAGKTQIELTADIAVEQTLTITGEVTIRGNHTLIS